MIKQFNYLWRLFGTCISFFVFGLVGVLLGLVLLPLAFVFVRKASIRKRIARSSIGFLFKWFSRLMSGLGVLDYRVFGTEHIETSGNRMIIANHPSLLDVVFLLSIFPMADCVVKKAIIYNPFMRGAVRPADYISNDDTGSFLEDSINRLKNGASLMLFPEATRSVPGQPLAFKMGAASIAVRAGAEILPVVIKCNPSGYLSKYRPWYWIPEQKPSYEIIIQPPLSIDELVGESHSQRDASHKLNDALMAYFTAQSD